MRRFARWRNPAAVAGRWSARHWKTATLAWFAFVAVAAVSGALVGTEELSDSGEMSGEAAQAERFVEEAGFQSGSSEVVLVQSERLTVDDVAFRAATRTVINAVRAVPSVAEVSPPFGASHRDQISADRHSVIVGVELRGGSGDPYDGVVAVRRAVTDVQQAYPDLRVEQTGDASLDEALDDTVGKDFKRAEWSAIPITIIVLLVAFGALVAALLPVVLALTAVVAATGVLAFASHLLPVDDATGSVMLLIGLAVGVDYSLFYVKREREERAAGRGGAAALDAAAATSGRSVLISGLTVIVAMGGMAFAGNQTFLGIGLGAIIVVAIAMVGSLTVLPAMLSRLGNGIEWGRIPGLRRVRAGGQSRMWHGLLDRVLRRPILSASLAGGLLVLLALPTLGLRTADPGVGDLPQDLAPVQTLGRVADAFPGTPEPAELVIRDAQVTSPVIRQALRDLERGVDARGLGDSPVDVAVNPDKTVAVVSIPLVGEGIGDPRSEQAVQDLRELSRSVFAGTGAEVAVGGDIAASRDFNVVLESHMPIVFAFVLGLAFLLLIATFRAPVLALTAIVLNLLSVGAAYGLLVLVFQHGVGEELLGFDSTGTIVAWMPLFLFVVLFGLSMDYHVFILSRIVEAREKGMTTRDAVAHGIGSTAGVVTAAACVMVFVFSVFASLSQLQLKELGVGLAAAVLIDATLVRGVLLPATMVALGDRNWLGHRRDDATTIPPAEAQRRPQTDPPNTPVLASEQLNEALVRPVRRAESEDCTPSAIDVP